MTAHTKNEVEELEQKNNKNIHYDNMEKDFSVSDNLHNYVLQ